LLTPMSLQRLRRGASTRPDGDTPDARPRKERFAPTRDTAFLEPSLRLRVYPSRSIEIGFESIDMFNCAIGPFGFDQPMLAVAQHDVEDRFWCCHSALHRCLPRRLRGRWVREGARNVGRLYRASRLRLTLPRAGPFLTTPRSVDTVYKMFVLRTVERGKRAKTLAKAHLKLVTPATVNRTLRRSDSPTASCGPRST
jgi:hypothetical protein